MKPFAGDKKEGTSILSHLENKFKYYCVPKIPSFIETYHLTFTTILWSLGNVILGLYALDDILLLWYVNLMIVLQYITDLFDGEVVESSVNEQVNKNRADTREIAELIPRELSAEVGA